MPPFFRWLRQIAKALDHAVAKRTAPRSRRFRPGVEVLEARAVPANLPPIAYDLDAGTVRPTALLSGTVAGALWSDPDDGNPNVVLLNGPTNGSVTLQSDGAFDYVANPLPGPGSTSTTDSFTFEVVDGAGLTSNPATVTIGVSNLNPTVAGDTETTDGSAVSGSVGGADGDGDSLSYSITVGPSLGTATINPVSGNYTVRGQK